MKRMIVVLMGLVGLFVLADSALAACEVVLISDCAGCAMRQQTVCREDPVPAFQPNRGVQDFINGAKAFEYGTAVYFNSDQRR